MENEASEDLEFSRVLFLLKRRAWVVGLVGLVAAVAAFLYSSTQTKLYKASADVQAVDESYGLTRNNGDPTPQREVNNALYLIASRAVQDPALQSIAPNDTKVRSIQGTSADQTDLVTITVVAESADVARDAANAVADTYVAQQENLNVQLKKIQANQLRQNADQLQDQINTLDQSLATVDASQAADLRLQKTRLVGQQADYRTRANELDAEADLKTGVIRVVAPAESPSSPFEPNPLRDALVAGLVGLFVGIAAVIMYDWINNRVTSPEEASRLSGELPVLAMIPLRGRHLRHRKLPASPRQFAESGSPAEEAYRALATNVRFSAVGRTSTTIAITSPSESEGKTTVVANLARTLATSGSKVAVVSADLRRPSLGEIFGVEESGDGLTTVLLGEKSLADVSVSVDVGSRNTLLFLPAGPLPANPQAVLGSEAMGAVLARLTGAGADIVLLDTAPILPVSDTLALAVNCDSVLLSVVPNSTKKTFLTESVKRLRRVGAEILGISLDGVLEDTLGYYGTSPSYYSSNGGKVNGSQVGKRPPTFTERGSASAAGASAGGETRPSPP